jgi:hypothetical protein
MRSTFRASRTAYSVRNRRSIAPGFFFPFPGSNCRANSIVVPQRAVRARLRSLSGDLSRHSPVSLEVGSATSLREIESRAIRITARQLETTRKATRGGNFWNFSPDRRFPRAVSSVPLKTPLRCWKMFLRPRIPVIIAKFAFAEHSNEARKYRDHQGRKLSCKPSTFGFSFVNFPRTFDLAD